MKTATAAVVGLALAFTSCGGSGGSSPGAHPSGSGSPSASASPSEHLPPYVVAKVDVGQRPCAVEGGFGSVWVSLYDEDLEARVDPSTLKVVARIKTGGAPCGVAVGGGAVWVENYGSNDITRIDPQTNTASLIKVGGAPYDVTYAFGAAWVTNYADNTVSRIDGQTRKVRTVKVGNSPCGVAPGGGAVWVTNKDDGTISRIDPATLKVTTTTVGKNPTWTSWGNGRLWISRGHFAEQIAVSGSGTGHPTTTARAGVGTTLPNDGDIDAGTVWLPDSDGRVHGYDARTGKALGTWAIGQTNPFVLAGYAGKLWVVDFLGTTLEELDPTRLR